MTGSPDPPAVEPRVTRVHATVKLQSSMWAELAAKERDDPDEQPRRMVQIMSERPENLSLHISLSAEDSTGRHIHTSRRDFGISGPRREIGRDIEDGINQMLGRDPSLHRPPRLSWENLIRALEQAGVHVTEAELIEAPLIIELTPEVQAELVG